MSEPKTLTEALATWPEFPADHPQTLLGLLTADPDTLTDPFAKFLREQALVVQQATEGDYVNSLNDAFELLQGKKTLLPVTGGWTTYALTGSRQVAVAPHPKGGVAPLRVYTAIIPKADQLPPLPYEQRTRTPRRTPRWLVIYGGTPEVLSKNGVAKGLATLARRAPVADVLFYTRDAGEITTPTLWSVKAGLGMSDNGGGGLTIPFPDAEALNEVRRNLP